MTSSSDDERALVVATAQAGVDVHRSDFPLQRTDMRAARPSPAAIRSVVRRAPSTDSRSHEDVGRINGAASWPQPWMKIGIQARD